MTDTRKTASQLRRQHNADLIRRMRNGEPLNAVDSKASWFPPRPVIEKDPREMARLYNQPAPEAPKQEAARLTETGDKKVVRFAPVVVYPHRSDPLGEAS